MKDVLNIEQKEAAEEAEKIKSVMKDNTINKLAKYTHSVLGLSDLSCDFDVNREKCRSCARRKV